jgi:hypothetical protein
VPLSCACATPLQTLDDSQQTLHGVAATARFPGENPGVVAWVVLACQPTAACDFLPLLVADSTYNLAVNVQNTGNVDLSEVAFSASLGAYPCTCPALPSAITVGGAAISRDCACAIPADPPTILTAVATVTATGLAATASVPVSLQLLCMGVVVTDAPTNYASTGELQDTRLLHIHNAMHRPTTAGTVSAATITATSFAP